MKSILDHTMNSPEQCYISSVPKSKNTCPHCHKIFSQASAKNRHIRNVHKQVAGTGRPKKNHFVCPLCDAPPLGRGKHLEEHLTEKHQITLEKVSCHFYDRAEYEQWATSEKIDVNYATNRTKEGYDFTEVVYVCNRSNFNGYKQHSQKRKSIKIDGVCPSKISVRCYENDQISVDFQTTHVGHAVNEVRSQRLSRSDKEAIVQRLKLGVPIDAIVEDARKVNSSETARINLLTKKDVYNLCRRYKIDTKIVGAIPAAHKKAESMRHLFDRMIRQVQFGEFRVQSSERSVQYAVRYDQVCKCRTNFCAVCQICIHPYKCDCSTYKLKNSLCTHVHMVSMYEHCEREKGVSSVPDDVELSEEDIKEDESSSDDQMMRLDREASIDALADYLRSLDAATYINVMDGFNAVIANVERRKESVKITEDC